jgi:sugar lactone lactonase YvrE
MTRSILPILLAGLVLPPAAADLEAVTPRRQQLLDRTRVERGTARGIAVRDAVGLRLAPRIREIPLQPAKGNPQPFVWCQTTDSQGRLYVGTGNEGRVFRVTPGGGIETYFQAGEIEITALVTDPDDYLFVAAAPRGRIYRVAPDGSSVLFFEADERYIWALKRTADGSLFAATGDRGILYRISPAGTAEIVLDSGDPHIVSLAVDGDGRLFAGTAGRGLVYRIDAGRVEILLETGADEVSALEVGPDGTLYAGLLESGQTKKAKTDEDGRRRRRLEDGSMPGLLPLTLQDEVIAPQPGMGMIDPRDELGRRGTIGSRLIAISSAGWVRNLWKDDREVLYSLAVNDGAIFAGTGRTGRRPGNAENKGTSAGGDRGDSFGGALRRFDESEGDILVARLPQTQVSSLLPRPTGGLFAATSNLGNLYWVENELVDSGTFTSAPVDAGLPARWGRIWWEGEAPPGSRVEFSTRSGDSERPDSTWSAWTAAAVDSEGSRIESPMARFLQWRVEIRGPAGGESPEVFEVWVSFQQENAPPVIAGLRVVSGSDRTGKSGAEPTAAAGDSDSGTKTDSGNGRNADLPGPDATRRVAWVSSDPNGDDLVFGLGLRSAQQEDWRPIATELEDNSFDWNTTAVSDGRYQIRLRGSDRPDNPPGSALTADLLSGFFIIDHTPPEVSVTGSATADGSARLDIQVTDNLSGVADIRYSLDGGPWVPVFPDDGISDSRRESARLSLTGLTGNGHSVRVRARDVEGNRGSGTFDFSLQP